MDSEPCLHAWAESLGGITYPLLSDFYPHGRVAEQFGVLRSDGKTERAIFVIDRQGIIRYVDVHDIDQQPENDELLRAIADVDPSIRPAYESILKTSLSSVEPLAEVVMYCTPWCEDCPSAREYFRANDIPYVEVDISRDRAAAARVRAWAGGDETTPTLNIRGNIIVTFDQVRVEAALGKKN